MSKNIDEKIDDLEAAKEQYMSENTVISIGGYSFTPAKLMIAGTIVTTVLGGLYGAFEVYKDYMDMKAAITEYVAPDLSEINKKLAVVAENAEKSVQYTQDIKNDLKADIRRVESIVDSVERSSKQSQRDTDISVKEVQAELRQTRKEVDLAIKETNANVDNKIKKALDNPLANQ